MFINGAIHWIATQNNDVFANLIVVFDLRERSVPPCVWHGGFGLQSGLRHGGWISPATHLAVREVPASTPTIKSVVCPMQEFSDLEL